MGAFTFRLEQVLRYRKLLESQAQQTLAEVMLALHNEQKRQEILRAELSNQQKSLASAGDLHADEVWLIQNYVASLLEDLTLSNAKIVALKEAVDRCRIELIEKAKDRELLDKLKEKQAVRHAHEERLIEQRVYDETATLRHGIQSF